MATAERDRTAHRPLKAETVDHFRRYARHMILDTGGAWVVEDYFLEVAEEVFKGTPEVWLDVPEGNAKTTNLAGFALYHADYVESASVPMAAASRDQTMTLFGQAAGFVRRSPPLHSRFRVLEGYRRIDALRFGGRIQVFAADERTGDGVIPTLALLEELHRQADLRLYRLWRGKLSKRGGQLVAISTAGEPGSEYEEAKDEAKRRASSVRRRGCHTVARSDGFVLHQYALKRGDDVHDLKLVKRANPFSGVTAGALREKHDSPTRLDSHWSRFTCGIPTRTEGAAITPEEWKALKQGKVPRGVPVWAGLDLGWKWDTTAVAPLWLPKPQRRVLGEPEIVEPPRDGTSTPPGKVRAALVRVHRRNPIHTVVLDPNAGGEQLVEWIEKPHDPEAPEDSDESGLGAEVVAYSQTNEPQAVAFERWMEALRGGMLRRPSSAEAETQVLNAVAKPVLGGRYRFDRPAQTRAKKKQRRRVIDYLQAASAVHAVAVADQPPPPIDPDNYRMDFL